MSASVFIRKFVRNAEDHGWRSTLEKGMRFLMKPFYERRVYRIYVIDLQKGVRRPSRDIDRLTFRVLAPGDGQLISQVETFHEWLRGSLCERIQEGGVCLTAVDGDVLAGFNLIAFGEVFIPLVNRKRQFRKHEAWSEQIAVMKEYRKLGLGSELRFRIFEELRKRGVRKLYGGALISNIPSLKLARSVGFQEVADISYRKVLTRKSWEFRKVK